MEYEEDDIKKRMFKAYFRRFGKDTMMPTRDIEFWEEDGRSYGCLTNVKGILAIYRIRNDSSLKWLKPKSRVWRNAKWGN